MVLLTRINTVAASYCTVRTQSGSSLSCSNGTAQFDYDLSGLFGQEFSGTLSTYTYRFRLDGILSETKCNQLKGAFCQYATSDGSFKHDCGVVTNPIDWDVRKINNDQSPQNGLDFMFFNGDTSGCTPTPTARKSIISLQCDPSASVVPSSWTITNAANTCNYEATGVSSAACPNSGGGGSSGSKLSGGSVFLIILVVVIPVYILVGCIYNRKRKGTTGAKESCPQNEFWCGLPSLAKDGCIFTWNKTFGRCVGSGSGGASAGSYETIK